MGNFKIIKKGYSQLEVDSYIEKLKNDYESRLSEQKDRIFYLKDQLDKITNSKDNELVTSLVSAVERAKLIENSSKNIYELETKKLNLLYTKMENLLNDENIYNDRSVKQELLALIQDCRKSLQNNISLQDQNLKESAMGDPVKRLLSKMIGFNKISTDFNKIETEKEPTTKTIKVVPTDEGIRKETNPNNIKVVQVKRQEVKEKEKEKVVNQQSSVASDFDKFLSEDSNLNGANFENIMFQSKKKKNASSYVTGGDLGDLSPNESGFDLKEAVNPKEDLDEIMKAFDFFNDENSKKKK
ncbi:MAG: hypothetical protein IJB10_05630 [Clostridia bacterium]|nr:hypothetical protein [Clostridia bacterium]